MQVILSDKISGRDLRAQVLERLCLLCVALIFMFCAAAGEGLAQDAALVEAPVITEDDITAGEGMPSVELGGDSLAPVEEKTAGEQDNSQVRSLFFTAQEMVAIRRALAVYMKIAAGDGAGDAGDFLRRLRGEEKQKQASRYFIYPQFFLASLVYDSADDWSVQINNQKITSKTPDVLPGIRIRSIDKDKVVVEWSPADLRKVEQVWMVAPNNTVDVDLRSGMVVFTLHPNQTFSSYVMKVLEGKVMPMVIDLSPNAAASDGKVPLRPGVASDEKTGNSFFGRNLLDNLMGGGKPKPANP